MVSNSSWHCLKHPQNYSFLPRAPFFSKSSPFICVSQTDLCCFFTYVSINGLDSSKYSGLLPTPSIHSNHQSRSTPRAVKSFEHDFLQNLRSIFIVPSWTYISVSFLCAIHGFVVCCHMDKWKRIGCCVKEGLWMQPGYWVGIRLGN